MNKKRLKLLINNLEMLLTELKEEVYSDTCDNKYDEIASYVADYDEIFDEENND